MVSEDEMAGQHHWCNEHELGQTLGYGEGQGSLACCSPWGCKVRQNWVTERQQRAKQTANGNLCMTQGTQTGAL